MKNDDMLYISVANKNEVMYDIETTKNVIREIISPLKDKIEIVVGSLDFNFLFGMYNIPQKVLNGNFEDNYSTRTKEFIHHLQENCSINLNEYNLVLVTGEENTRCVRYRKQDELYHLNRDFDKQSKSKIQYLIIDLETIYGKKISSTYIRDNNITLKARDVWEKSITLKECNKIDRNIEKIIH